MRRWALIATLCAAGLAQAAPVAPELPASCPAGLPATDALGRALPVAASREQSLLVVFWSPDCAFCRRHNEKLRQLLHEVPGAAVITVGVDDSALAIRTIASRRAYDFPVLVEGDGACALRPQLTPRRVVPMTCWLGDAPTQPRCIPGEMSVQDLRELLMAQARSRRHSW
ncbi:MAG: redoxin domain-containing protein [Roseateles sp.]|nr:MAG: redoxin domain-containing protein [Roseateles sp.]